LRWEPRSLSPQKKKMGSQKKKKEKKGKGAYLLANCLEEVKGRGGEGFDGFPIPLLGGEQQQKVQREKKKSRVPRHLVASAENRKKSRRSRLG